MTIFDSLMVSVFGMSVVFLVLVLLSFLVSLQSRAVSILEGKKSENVVGITDNAVPQSTPDYAPDTNAEELSAGELKLNGVDEKTAAMIMAIVSDESGISLSELQFKSIKAV